MLLSVCSFFYKFLLKSIDKVKTIIYNKCVKRKGGIVK